MKVTVRNRGPSSPIKRNILNSLAHAKKLLQPITLSREIQVLCGSGTNSNKTLQVPVNLDTLRPKPGQRAWEERDSNKK